LARRGAGVKAGRLKRFDVDTDEFAAGRRRAVYLYKPPVKEPVPLLVVYDGSDYLRRGKLTEIVDNLIAQKRIRPLALALIQNGRQARMLEYGCSEMTLGFVMERVLKLAKKHIKLIDIESRPGAYGVLGASMGGLQALYTGLRLPQVFGRVISQSGAFRIDAHEFIAMDMVRHLPAPDIDVWLDVGKFEWLAACNREMNHLLLQSGYRVTYREYSGGHNYTAWRDDLWRGLETLFG
jgi:enterochelin esterase family protein